jgi:hypothetical protein
MIASSNCYCDSRTATVLVSPALQVADVDFLVPSATKSTLCGPAVVETPIFGVRPSGRPSSTTREAGSELKFSVQLPDAAEAFGASAGASFLATAAGAAFPPAPLAALPAGALSLPVSAAGSAETSTRVVGERATFVGGNQGERSACGLHIERGRALGDLQRNRIERLGFVGTDHHGGLLRRVAIATFENDRVLARREAFELLRERSDVFAVDHQLDPLLVGRGLEHRSSFFFGRRAGEGRKLVASDPTRGDERGECHSNVRTFASARFSSERSQLSFRSFAAARRRHGAGDRRRRH